MQRKTDTQKYCYTERLLHGMTDARKDCYTERLTQNDRYT